MKSKNCRQILSPEIHMMQHTIFFRPRWLILMVLIAFSVIYSCDNPEKKSLLNIEFKGKVEINGNVIDVNTKCVYDKKTLSYEFKDMLSGATTIGQKEKLLLSYFPRLALVFLESGEGKNSLIDRSKNSIDVQFDMSRKVDKVSSVVGSLKISKSKLVSVSFEGKITTPLDGDRPVEPDGESVIRIGVNPQNGTFVGGARLNYDLNQPDVAALGTADFWNINGKFSGTNDDLVNGYAHVNRCGGDLAKGIAKGTILSFPATSVFEPGIITLSGVAKKDGIIHQYKGIANQAGGGSTLFTFPVRIKKGMTGSDVAKLIEDGFTNERVKGSNEKAKYVLAIQGGDGLKLTAPDRTSSRVSVSMTTDGGKTIANKFDSKSVQIFSQIAVQSFSDQLVVASENTGIRNQFGIVGSPTLNGWLTPFKAVFSTDNPRTNFLSAGGDVAILLNWSENIKGQEANKENNTDFGDLVVTTKKGESAEAIVARLTDKLKQQVTRWGSRPFIQRMGNTVYIDAGIDFPHSVSLASNDEGVGYMSAAADLPFFLKQE